VAERNVIGGVINRFDRGAGQRVIRSEHHGWYLHNVRGDVSQRTNASGNVIHTYRYTGFGIELTSPQNNGVASNSPFRFAGMYWDGHRNEYMTQHRMFSPRLGRWLSPDPHFNMLAGNMVFGDSPTLRNDRYMPSIHAILQSGNLFVYTMNNPVRWVDPDGTFAVCPWTLKQVGKYLYQKAKPYLDPVYQWAKPKVVNIGLGIKNDAIAVGRWVQGHAARKERWVVNTFNSVTGRNQTIQFGGARLQAHSTMRDSLLNTAQNPQLRNIINELYRPGGHIGDGGTAAMLRHEFFLGLTPTHLQKANERIAGLQNLYRNHGGTMSFNDIEIALQLLNDLKAAVSLFP